MEFPRQECWNGCHFLLQGVFPTQGLNLSLRLAGKLFSTMPPGKPDKAYRNKFGKDRKVQTQRYIEDTLEGWRSTNPN